MGQGLIVQYTATLMNGLTNLVHTAPSLVVKAKAMAAITSIVIANENKIEPYFDSILPLLDMCFSVKDGEHFMRLRGGGTCMPWLFRGIQWEHEVLSCI